MIIVQKPFLSQIDTHTRLFFIVKENERNDEKDFVIYAKSKRRSNSGSNFEIFDSKYLIEFYRQINGIAMID